MPDAAVFLRTEDADDRLWRLARLSRADLLQAVAAAVVAVGGCTANDPPTARGYDAWRMAVRRLREVLMPQGWERDDTGNFSTVMNRLAGVRIAVVNTDGNTGNPHAYPTNRSRKGALADRASEINQRILPFPEWDETEPEGASLPGIATWYLCVYVEGERVRAELSLPTKVQGGFFADWQERIILVGSNGDWSIADAPHLGDDDGPVFEVAVTRK
ncbi:MAG: hypothetical protein K2X11_11930 [Acetobacteraceae bacterium]|nr:hypothetical protein [Acetobacteraceae bacterium]